ncbi:MAG: hypothetical protein E4H27_09165 [Anaerolineales bacterium]|nr:MAG: hypothetical protein E4H27_09165 [Anaerolineales bacterium]
MKGHLATVIPFFHKVRSPLTRDSAFILFVALNTLIMGLETYLAHVLNGTIRFNEWIPVVCGPFFAILLVISFALARRKPQLALWLAATALVGSIIVGLLGTYFHFIRAIRPFAASGDRVSIDLLVWGAPVFAPPTFILVGVLGLIALVKTDGQKRGGTYGSGLPGRLPLAKDQFFFVLASLGILIATISSLFDHLRGGFDNPWLWLPTLSGLLGIVTALVLAILKQPGRGDLTIYTGVMCLLLCVGPLGLLFHVLHDLGPGSAITIERFLRGAPVLAPMVFANMALLGLIVLLDPD